MEKKTPSQDLLQKPNRQAQQTLPLRTKTSSLRHVSSRQSGLWRFEPDQIPQQQAMLDTPRMEEIQDQDEDDEDDAFISIGVDIGTTYSGVAWALSTSPQEINIVSTWESELPASYDLHKVPSALTYNSKGAVTSWGYKLEAHRHSISWFKLGLSEYGRQQLAEEQPEKYKELHALLKFFGKEPIDVMADYLKCIWKYATDNIQRRIGKHLWENLKLKIVVTVPAIWDHKAQELTRKAAQMAGLHSRNTTELELIGEPEAAALAVFDEMSTQRKRMLQVGDPFIVCDAGGGTVDLISYKIEQLEPLKLAMCSESTGGLCGAIFLDVAFEKHIRTMISAEDYEKLSDRSKIKMMHEWEYGAKRGFRVDAAEHGKWYVDIPGYLGVHDIPEVDQFERSFAPRYPTSPMFGLASRRPFSHLREHSPSMIIESPGADRGTVTLQTGHLKAIFSEVCSKIKDLVGDQLAVITARESVRPKAILLVGGFGENTYLCQELERSFNGIEIQQPTKAWAAICRGAVLRGLGNQLVVNHISKYNYGITCAPDFQEGYHLEVDRVADAVRQVPVAKNQMRWFLHRGENVEKSEPVTRNYFFALANPRDLRKLKIDIFYSDSSNAEERKVPTVKPLCKLEISLDSSVFYELPEKTNGKGAKWRQFDYILELQVSSGQLCWSAKYKSIEAGTIKTQVGYEGLDNQT